MEDMMIHNNEMSGTQSIQVGGLNGGVPEDTAMSKAIEAMRDLNKQCDLIDRVLMRLLERLYGEGQSGQPKHDEPQMAGAVHVLSGEIEELQRAMSRIEDRVSRLNTLA